MIKLSINRGYLTARSTDEASEMYTPYYAVAPIMKYISVEKTIWCPFDKEWSAFYQSFLKAGYKVIRSHIEEGKDFFEYEPENYDVIISNPPFSKKDEVLKRLYSFNKPFAVLLPMNSLQGQKRYQYFKQGIQLLAFDQRIGYHNQKSMEQTIEGVPFATAYFCRRVLPKDLIIEHLDKYQKKLDIEGDKNE